jgi:hypothetical protein
VPFLQRWFMWGAVRLGSLTDRDGRPGWLRDAPAVLLVLLVALPVIAVPTLAVTVGLLLFGLLELVTYGVLLVVHGGRPRDREPVRPRPTLRT